MREETKRCRRTENMALRRHNERGEAASEMPGALIKVAIVGFATVNPTSRRRVGGKETAGGTSFYERRWLRTRC